ncbi:MAG TPA: RidA family protein [Stellaceae bacterium]|nr:RidA family protein [Stellaceae bacterium]
MPKITSYAAKGVYDPPAYSQAVKIEEGKTLLYIAGQVDYNAEGKCAHPGDFAAQTKAVLGMLKAQVEAGGGTMASIVKINTYVTDMRYRPEYAKLRGEFFGPKAPASTMVAITALADPDFLIEIEAVAVV